MLFSLKCLTYRKVFFFFFLERVDKDNFLLYNQLVELKADI